MISAFGVEHSEVSKGLPKGARTADTAYAVPKKLAHQRGRLAAKLKAQGDDVTARRKMNAGREAKDISRKWNQNRRTLP